MRDHNKSIYNLLDSMLSLLENSPTMPFTGYKLIGAGELQTLIEQAVVELPGELAAAKDVLLRKEHLISSIQEQSKQTLQRARAQSEEILQSAQRQAQQILSQSEIIKEVNAEAERIRQQVYQEVREAHQRIEQEISQAERQAHERIKLSLQEAQQEAKSIQEEAYEHAGFVLQKVTELTRGASDIMQNGHKQLSQMAHTEEQQNKQLQRFKDSLSQVENLPGSIDSYFPQAQDQAQDRDRR